MTRRGGDDDALRELKTRGRLVEVGSSGGSEAATGDQAGRRRGGFCLAGG